MEALKKRGGADSLARTGSLRVDFSSAQDAFVDSFAYVAVAVGSSCVVLPCLL